MTIQPMQISLQQGLPWTLQQLPERENTLHILYAALQAVDPAQAVQRCMQRKESKLSLAGRIYDLENYRQVKLVGVGKAGFPMAQAAESILGPYLCGGVILVKEDYLGEISPLSRLQYYEAGHPLPDERGLEGSRRLLDFLAGGEPDDLVIALISGGGSALLIDLAPEIRLEDLQVLNENLLACGADIQDINTLRKHLDLVKGGGLALRAAPARVVSLILSDVIGDPLDVIASGPTVPDETTFDQAWNVLRRYELLDKTPPAILHRLQRGIDGELEDTPKSGDPRFERVQNLIIGSNSVAAQAALSAAHGAGFHESLLTTFLCGEAYQAGRFLGSLLRQVAASGQPLSRPACLIAGGETTVTLPTYQGKLTPGLGGRNLELALGAVDDLAGLRDILLVTLATDGGDGPTDAAGAVVSGETLARAQALGLDPQDYRIRHDSYHFFAALGDLLKTGPTRTNVNDLAFLFAY